MEGMGNMNMNYGSMVANEARSRSKEIANRKTETTTIKSKGKEPMRFKKGALHEQMGVPEGEPIPEHMKKAALAGRLGPLAKKRAIFAFRGALKAGRETAHGR